MKKYTITPVNDDLLWDDFVESSPQGTVFSLSEYLHLAVDNYKRFWVKKGSAIKGGISVVLTPDGTECVLDDLVIHNGLMFAQDESIKPVRARQERFEITEYVISWLTKQYKKVELALSPQFEDLRPFLWHNYHSTETRDRFGIDLRYTSYLDISSLKAFENEEESIAFKSLITLRQRNIRQGRKDNSGYIIEKTGEVFVDWYLELMNKQGVKVPQDKSCRMVRLINGLIQKGMAKMLVCLNGKGQKIYSTVFCWDRKRAYYLFGASIPNVSESYMGTMAFWETFKLLAEQGYDCVDMEGVNSPDRGRFKLGFGGSLESYYEVVKI